MTSKPIIKNSKTKNYILKTQKPNVSILKTQELKKYVLKTQKPNAFIFQNLKTK